MYPLLTRVCGFVVVVWLCTSTGWAQTAFIYNSLQKNGFISASYGISLPTGDFGKRTYSEQRTNGMAVPGSTWSLSGGYRLAGPMGLMARYEETLHDIEPAALAAQYGTGSLGDAVKGITAAGRAGQWQGRGILLGPYVTIPLGRLAFDFRAMAGQAWTTSPENGVEGVVNWRETMVRSGNSESKAIATNLGFTLRYRITPAVGLHASTDYSSATFHFTDVPLTTRTADEGQQTTYYNTTRTLSMVNVSAGITFQFRSKNKVF
jgi:hypothetical protein